MAGAGKVGITKKTGDPKRVSCLWFFHAGKPGPAVYSASILRTMAAASLAAIRSKVS